MLNSTNFKHHVVIRLAVYPAFCLGLKSPRATAKTQGAYPTTTKKNRHQMIKKCAESVAVVLLSSCQKTKHNHHAYSSKNSVLFPLCMDVDYWGKIPGSVFGTRRCIIVTKTSLRSTLAELFLGGWFLTNGIVCFVFLCHS